VSISLEPTSNRKRAQVRMHRHHYRGIRLPADHSEPSARVFLLVPSAGAPAEASRTPRLTDVRRLTCGLIQLVHTRGGLDGKPQRARSLGVYEVMAFVRSPCVQSGSLPVVPSRAPRRVSEDESQWLISGESKALPCPHDEVVRRCSRLSPTGSRVSRYLPFQSNAEYRRAQPRLGGKSNTENRVSRNCV
jgi:hypothetical protein